MNASFDAFFSSKAHRIPSSSEGNNTHSPPSVERLSLSVSMAAVDQEVEVDSAPASTTKDDAPEPVAEPAPQPEEVPPPAAESAPGGAPVTPAAASSTEMTDVVVDVEPSPGAAKFFGTVSAAGEHLSTLNSDEVSDGMLELSRRCKNDAVASFDTFKTHALDVAVVATSAPASADEKAWKLALKQTEWRKLAQLPLAAMYALFALFAVCAFAVIYYPKQYGPQLYDKAKTKVIEWQVVEKAEVAGVFIKTHASTAYTVAANSGVAAKGAEVASKAAESASEAVAKATANPAVAGALAKASETAELARAKVAEKLVELKGGAAPRSASPEVSNGV